MRLLDTLQRLAAEEQSPFRAQLAREDVARRGLLQELARSAPDLASFEQRGMRLGWTQGDLRTTSLSIRVRCRSRQAASTRASRSAPFTPVS